MSSPRSIAGGMTVRDGTRVVLREITASLHNSPPMQSARRKSGNESSSKGGGEHEVKVRFAREFADVGSISYSAPESLSSASSFHSLSSTLSTKSSSGICPDSVSLSPNDTINLSYANTSIPGVDDLISACAGIRLNTTEKEPIEEEEDRSFAVFDTSRDISQDQTFASATDEQPNDLIDDDDSLPLDPINVTQTLEVKTPGKAEETGEHSTHERKVDVQERPILGTICIRDSFSVVSNASSKERESVLNSEDKSAEKESFSLSENIDITSGFHTCISVTGLEEHHLLPETEELVTSSNTTVCLSTDKSDVDIVEPVKLPSTQENSVVDGSSSSLQLELNPNNSLVLPSVSSASLIENVECPTLPSITAISLLSESSERQIEVLREQNASPSIEDLLATSSSPVNNSSIVTHVSNTSAKLSGSIQEIIPCNPINHEQESELNASSNLVSPTAFDTSRTEEEPGIQLNVTQVIPAEVSREETENQVSDSVEENQNALDSSACTKLEASPNVSNELPAITSELNKSENNKSGNASLEIDIKENVIPRVVVIEALNKTVELEALEEPEEEEKDQSQDKLDTTLTIQNTSLSLETAPEIEQYTDFKPPRQSTTLTLPSQGLNFDDLRSAADEIANDILKSTFELQDESENFVSATSEIFQDPTTFDFLLARSHTQTVNRLRADSLYVKFDPLVGETSMLPQSNTQTINEEQNGKNESPLPANVGTPKRNPAIAAIDRLLFYSPIPSGTIQKTEESKEKISSEESKKDTALIADVNMSKELELVRATVLQLEEELENQKKEYEADFEKQKKEYEADLERQKNGFQEKINKLQAQIAQEMNSKSQMTVVVEEYEKSISRLHTQREKDRTSFEQERAKLQEELQAAQEHLTNTEAAFNDVHQKYERLKGVVAVYKSNEAVLKEGIQENVDTIKNLDVRYDQLKQHAIEQLENANLELESMRKQHEDETVKLHALLRKAELKSNSLAELVEQKTKENKELTQILDEVIARVGHQNTE